MKVRVTKVLKEMKPFLQLTENINRKNRKMLQGVITGGLGQFGTGQIFAWPDAVGGQTIGYAGANGLEGTSLKGESRYDENI
jgi:hypothetical protein